MTLFKNLMKGTLFTFLVMVFASSSLRAQTVTLNVSSATANPYEGCEEYNVTFSADITNLGSLTVTSAELDFGGGDVVTDANWASQGYKITRNLKAGVHDPSLIVTFSDNSVIKRSLSTPVRVYNTPKVDFELANDKDQCFETNEFEFTDLSESGDLIKGQTTKNKLVKWSWDFGDGSQNTVQNAKHSYKSSGTFDVILTVTDEKGCSDRLEIADLPNVYPEIGVKFTAAGPVGCPTTDIRFRNFTSIDFNLVEKWIWDWGTGRKHIDTFYANNPTHVATRWTDFEKMYNKDGYSSPKLVVFTKDGCADSLTLKDAIRVVNYNFDITWLPDTPCFQDNFITFRMKPRPNATQFLWTFGDPDAMILNFDNENWSAGHNFVGGPGFYNINLSITEPPCPVRDTTICFVKLKGPAAAITLPPPPDYPSNSCKDPREISKADFERLKYDHCYRASYDPKATQYAGSNPGEISFAYVTHGENYKVDSYFVYCNAPVNDLVNDTAVNKQPVTRYKVWEHDDGIAESYAMGCGPDDDSAGFRYPYTVLQMLPEPDTSFGKWRYRYKSYTQAFQPAWSYTDPIPVKDSIEVKDTFFNLSTGQKVYRRLWLHAPYIKVHTINKDGYNFLYRAKSPLPYVDENGQDALYYPPMFPGDPIADCKPATNDEWRTMHDSDLYTLNCGGPNLVSFTNNSTKYRTFGKSGDDLPLPTNYSWDNQSSGMMGPIIGNRMVDSCRTNQNFPWATDSMQYFWDFGDGTGDQCTTMVDANGNIVAIGMNPSGNVLRCQYSTLVAPQHLYLDPDCYNAELTVYDPETGCEAKAGTPIVMTEPDGGPEEPAGAKTVYDVDHYNQEVLLNDEGDPIRQGVVVGRGAAPCVGTPANPYYQSIVIQETLPACGRQDVWMVLDGENVCDTIACVVSGNGKILKDHVIIKGNGNFLNPGKYTFTIPGNADEFAEGYVIVNQLGVIEKAVITNEGEGYASNFDSIPVVFNNPLALLSGVTMPIIYAENLHTVNPTFDISNKGFNLKPNATINAQLVNPRDASKSGSVKLETNINGEVTKVTLDNAGSGWLATDKIQVSFDSLFKAFDQDIEIYGVTEINTSYISCTWTPKMALDMMGWQISYPNAGWKDIGIVIKVGDCLDTFFYDDYKYIVDANSKFLVSPLPMATAGDNVYTVEDARFDSVRTDLVYNAPHPDSLHLRPLKLPRPIVLSVTDSMRNDPPSKANGFHNLDSIKKFEYFIIKTANNCGPVSEGVLHDSLEMFPKGFRGATRIVTQDTLIIDADTLYKGDTLFHGDTNLINLHDTVMYTITTPGKYTITSLAEAGYGTALCAGALSREVWVGQFQCFTVSDNIICGDGAVTFKDSVYYWNKLGAAACVFEPWNTTCIDLNKYFWLTDIYPDDSMSSRIDLRKQMIFGDDWDQPIAENYSPPKYWERVAWDFNATRGIQDHERKMDTTKIDYWGHLPAGTADQYDAGKVSVTYGDGSNLSPTEFDVAMNLGVGVYDVTLWVQDSMGAWMPTTINDAVNVVSVTADFDICDTCQYELVCTPAGVFFEDNTEIIEESGTYRRVGVKDSVVKWDWTFGDGRDNSFLQDPLHNYLRPDTFDVTLKIETEQGCVSEITKPAFIKIIGPEAKFSIDSVHGCVPFTVDIYDSSKLTQSWEWQLGDGTFENSNGEGKVSLKYNTAGEFKLKLIVSADVKDPITGVVKSCIDSFPNSARDEQPIFITVRPLDSIAIKASDTLICPDDEVRFTFDAAKSYAGYDTLDWNLGVSTDNIISPVSVEQSQVYSESGEYVVTLTGSGDWPLCPTYDTVKITVKEVTAVIELGEGRPNHNPSIGNYVFLNKSQNGVVHTWEIYDESSTLLDKIVRSDTSRLVYDKFENGKYNVVLTVSDDTDPDKACIAVDSVLVDVTPLIETFNVFSPNNDGVNDWFEIKLQAATEYQLTIYNRWGEVIYKGSQDDNINCRDLGGEQSCQFWNGKNYKTDAEAPAGTYYWIFDYTFKNQEPATVHGTVTLLR